MFDEDPRLNIRYLLTEMKYADHDSVLSPDPFPGNELMKMRMEDPYKIREKTDKYIF